MREEGVGLDCKSATEVRVCVDLPTLGLSMSLRRLSSVNTSRHVLLAHDFVRKRWQGSCHIADELFVTRMWSVFVLMWPKLVFQSRYPRAVACSYKP